MKQTRMKGDKKEEKNKELNNRTVINIIKNTNNNQTLMKEIKMIIRIKKYIHNRKETITTDANNKDRDLK